MFSAHTKRRFRALFGMFILCGVGFTTRAIEPETIGLTAMRRERPAITGAGIPVAQPEGEEGFTGSYAFEVDPAVNASVFFTWTSDRGTATNYPNTVGTNSYHAGTVSHNFYGTDIGVAPGVPSVDSYEANYFANQYVVKKLPIAAWVVNQSFIFGGPSTNVDPFYDNYAALYNVLFVSGNDNSPSTPYAPGTAYNSLSVGILSSNAMTSIGPTTDGRAKPEIVAPDYCCSSYTTPQVAGAAVLLWQAGGANDGGAGTASLATNSATIKALLINGAVKMTNWTNGVTRPLDARYGAGVLNIYNSDLQLRGGRRTALAINDVPLNAAHPPTSATNNVASLRGWDYSTIASLSFNDRVAHYYFNLPTNAGPHSVTATLVWKKMNSVALANLDLFLYDTRSNTLVLCSTSGVDNVEHLFIPKLAAGRYDLQVLKHGAALPGTESYALAFDFSPVKLALARSGTNAVISWPASPAGFVLQSTPALDAVPVWQAVAAGSLLSNSMNTVTLPASASAQFFRLFRP